SCVVEEEALLEDLLEEVDCSCTAGCARPAGTSSVAVRNKGRAQSQRGFISINVTGLRPRTGQGRSRENRVSARIAERRHYIASGGWWNSPETEPPTSPGVGT